VGRARSGARRRSDRTPETFEHKTTLPTAPTDGQGRRSPRRSACRPGGRAVGTGPSATGSWPAKPGPAGGRPFEAAVRHGWSEGPRPPPSARARPWCARHRVRPPWWPCRGGLERRRRGHAHRL